LNILRYFTGQAHWIKIDGNPIKYCSMTSKHFNNAIRMLRVKNHELDQFQQGEVLARELIKILNNDQSILVTWLTSDDLLLRTLAKRAIDAEQSQGWSA